MSPARERAIAAAAIAVCVALLLWVVSGVSQMESRPGYAGHYYESLVDGFLHGHTYLDVAPSPELARLKDPFDPAQNAGYRLADATYYQGRYYLYYGPTPAVTLMLPWRVLTGRHMPERVASVVFATLALAGLGLLLLEIRARHFPGFPGWGLALLLLLALHAVWLPVLLRRPGFWELPHVSALASLWWALFFLWRCRSEPTRAVWPVALGIALVLLIGSRPTFFFAAGALSLAALVPTNAANGEPRRFRVGLALLAVPLAVGGAALALYNVLRFGRVMEFGQSYQLLNTPELRVAHFSASHLGFNAWVYIAALPELSPYFPFFKTVTPAALPPGYIMTEEMHGIFFALPVHFVGIFALLWLWIRGRDAGVRPLGVVLGAGVAASVLSACVLFCWFGSSTRYITELTGGWTLATLVGLMALFGGPLDSWRGKALRAAALAASIWTVGYVWLASFEHGGMFRATNPRAYASLARTLDWPSAWVARSRGVVFGPVEVTIALGPYQGPETCTLLSSGRRDMMNRLVLRRSDAAHVTLCLKENETPVVSLGDIPAGSGTLTVRVEAPWLYPPPEHPFWDRYSNPLEAADRKTRFSLRVGEASSVGYPCYCFDATGLDPVVKQQAYGSSAWVMAVKRLSAAP
jgi:hypothetical protein